MQYTITDVSLEFLGFGNPAKKRLENLKQLSANFNMAADIFGKELENAYVNLDKDILKDKYNKGDIVTQAPSSKDVLARNQKFINLLKEFTRFEFKTIPSGNDLENLYFKTMNGSPYPGKFADTYDPERKGFMLRPLDTKAIIYPQSGWFGLPGIQVRRSCEQMSPLLRSIGNKLASVKEDDVKEREDYGRISVLFSLYADVFHVVEAESIDWLYRLEK